jgi:peptide/nickel transport system substrate-binding protein
VRRRLPLALLLLAAACAGDDSRGPVGGTVVVATAADADALLPPLVRTSQGRFASELLFDPLVEIGASLNTVGDADFQPRLAERWTWSADSLAITFELNANAKWHDGRPVTATDVEAGYLALMDSVNGAAARANLTGITSVTADGDRRVIIRYATRTPEQFYAASVIFPLPSHLLPADGGPLTTSALAQNPVGSGPFRFVAWEPLERLELAAVEDHYRGRAPLDRVIVSISPEPATAQAKVWAEEADVIEVVPAGDIPEALSHAHVRLVTGNGFDYAYMAFNLRDARNRERPHPLFTDLALRRAIAQAVDREQVVRAIFDTLAYVANAPVVHRQFTYDSTIRALPVDRARAAAALDSLGWRVDARDGIRRRNGQQLTFTALVPGSSRNRERAAVLIQEQLRLVGIAMEIERTENRTFTQMRQDGKFDVVFGGWLTVPSPGTVRGTWGSSAREGWGNLNDGRWENAAFDSAVAAGVNAMDKDQARSQFARAYQIIADDVPALFLYESRPVAAVHRRINLPAWRADGWWRSLHEWSVDPEQRLPRDARPAN